MENAKNRNWNEVVCLKTMISSTGNTILFSKWVKVVCIVKIQFQSNLHNKSIKMEINFLAIYTTVLVSVPSQWVRLNVLCILKKKQLFDIILIGVRDL